MTNYLNLVLKHMGMVIMFLSFTVSAYAQDRTITGTVTDGTSGEPLIGGTVQIRGTTVGTITDINGNYQITVNNPEAVLIFSFVGLETVEIPVGDQEVINVVMNPDIAELEEIVVIGYGTKRKEDLTGSVTVVSTDELQRSTATTLSKALQGRAAGVYVRQSGGEPGSGATIRIRGIGSINANPDPLIIIDGVPSDINIEGGIPRGGLDAINPEDIESFQVLKDASASAIYGARAANGVILIQTKRGKADKTEITFDMQFRRINMYQRLDLMDAENYKKWLDAAYEDPQSTLTKPIAYSDSVISLHNTNTDWQEEIVHPAWEQNYHLRLSGGNDRANYSFSGNYFTGEGTFRLSCLRCVCP